MIRSLALFASLVLLSGCGTGFHLHRVDLDRPVEIDARLTPDVATYGDVLHRLGPPAAVGGFEESGRFAFLYDHLHVFEWMGKLSYQNVQATYSRGTSKQHALLVVFSPDGKLDSSAPMERKAFLGWGFSAGHSATPELFFRFRDYLAKDTKLLRWGADLLDPRGKRILIESGKGLLYTPGQSVTFGED